MVEFTETLETLSAELAASMANEMRDLRRKALDLKICSLDTAAVSNDAEILQMWANRNKVEHITKDVARLMEAGLWPMPDWLFNLSVLAHTPAFMAEWLGAAVNCRAQNS